MAINNMTDNDLGKVLTGDEQIRYNHEKYKDKVHTVHDYLEIVTDLLDLGNHACCAYLIRAVHLRNRNRFPDKRGSVV